MREVKPHYLFSIVAACCLWLIGIPVHGAVVVLSPVDDGFGTDQPRDGVFDVFFPSNSVYVVGELGNGESRGVLEFSLSAIPAGAIVNSAKLQLHVVSAVSSDGGAPVQLETRLYAGDGIAEIEDLTRSGAQMGPIPTGLGDNPQFTYTSDFQSLFASGAQYAGFTLLGDSNNFIVEFGSRNYSNLAARPTLTVDYTVPEPPMLTLFSIGSIALLFARRHMTAPK
jgi:hypothetical protein